jgi:hypothetical protein
MGKVSYSEIGGPGGKLARCQEFRGNSMRAERTDTHYIIYSYRTVIGTYDLIAGELDDRGGRYSVTTSRHQGLMRAWTGRAR